MVEKAKSFIKSVFPGVVRIYRHFGKTRQTLPPRLHDLEDIFSSIHQSNLWADAESVSGRGSTLQRTGVIRRSLPTLLENVGAKSLFDAACGDFNWMRRVALENIEYIGADVVPELITRNRRLYENENRSFVLLDITSEQLPTVDVILCRDCFIHLSSSHIHAAIAAFKRSNSVFLLATTHTSVQGNKEIRTGEWRSVNLQLPPFNFAPPMQLILEDPDLGKCLGLWRLQEL